jgi:CRISPR-associated Csx2 family protein
MLITFTSGPKRERPDPRPPTIYRFHDGEAYAAAHFAPALLAKLSRSGTRPTRLLVIGTANSAWESIGSLAGPPACDAHAAVTELSAKFAGRPDAARLSASDLAPYEHALRDALDLDVALRIAENTGDSVFSAVADVVAQDERVVLDITHSFRSMPVHALIALGALRWLRGVEIVDILYGALDEQENGFAPARSLAETAILARATPDLAKLSLEDDLGAVAGYLGAHDPELGRALAETQRFESALQFGDARPSRRMALERLQEPRGDAATQAVAKQAAEVVRTLDCGEGSRLLHIRARRAYARHDFLRAIALAYEAIDLRVDEMHDLRAKVPARSAELKAAGKARNDHGVLKLLIDEALELHFAAATAPRHPTKDAEEAYGSLRAARNAVAHARPKEATPDSPKSLQTEEGLRALLEWSFRFYEFLE